MTATWIQLPSGRFLNLANVAGAVQEAEHFVRLDYVAADSQVENDLVCDFISGDDADALLGKLRRMATEVRP
jgi:hypothetical protein